MELIGLIIFASLFVVSGVKHIRHDADMVAYTTAAMGKCPVAKPIGYLGGWPTGLFLVVFGAGVVLNEHVIFAYGLAAFLAVAVALFHRDFINDPAGFKTVALIGAALFIASHVH